MAYWKIIYKPNINMNNPQLAFLLGKIEGYSSVLLKMVIPQSISERFNALKIKREVLGTTAIEGNAAAQDNINNEDSIDDVIKNTSNTNEKIELENSKEVIAFIYNKAIEEFKGEITKKLILKLHGIITKGLLPDKDVGHLRTENIKVGKNYSGEVFEKVPQQVDTFIKFINSEEAASYDPIIRAVLSHFYLVSIHPFIDGNGRTSRALETYVLACYGKNVKGFYSLANFYYENRDAYFNKLHEARFKHKGDLNDFITFALNGFVEQLERNHDEILAFYKKIAYKDLVDELLLNGRINKRIRAFLRTSELLQAPITINALYSDTDLIVNQIFGKVSSATKRRDLKKMLEFNLVYEKDKKIYLNYDIMNRFSEHSYY